MKRHPLARQVSIDYWYINRNLQVLGKYQDIEAGLELVLEISNDLRPKITNPFILQIYQEKVQSSISWNLHDVRTRIYSTQHAITYSKEGRIKQMPLG